MEKFYCSCEYGNEFSLSIQVGNFFSTAKRILALDLGLMCCPGCQTAGGNLPQFCILKMEAETSYETSISTYSITEC
jgi:hypothetical protein